MSKVPKRPLKTIKVTETTHAKLAVIATALNKTIVELIDDLLAGMYPDIDREAGRALSKIRALKAEVDSEREK